MPRRLVRVDPAPIRSKPVCVRLTPQEFTDAKALADANGMTVPDLLRKCLLVVQITETTHV